MGCAYRTWILMRIGLELSWEWNQKGIKQSRHPLQNHYYQDCCFLLLMMLESLMPILRFDADSPNWRQFRLTLRLDGLTSWWRSWPRDDVGNLMLAYMTLYCKVISLPGYLHLWFPFFRFSLHKHSIQWSQWPWKCYSHHSNEMRTGAKQKNWHESAKWWAIIQ